VVSLSRRMGNPPNAGDLRHYPEFSSHVLIPP
jgi:hypothetical protein